MKYTPAPWKIETDDSGPYAIGPIEANGKGGAWLEASMVDIKLAAAAPELYEAAKNAQCECSVQERLSGHITGCWMPDLIDAIAKAEGK